MRHLPASTNSHSLDNTFRPRRKKCALKEKQRNEAINEAYDELKELIPFINQDQKTPKIKTLKTAILYIEFLDKILAMPPGATDTSEIEAEYMLKISQQMQVRNCYVDRATEEIHGSNENSTRSNSPVTPSTASSSSSTASSDTWLGATGFTPFAPLPAGAPYFYQQSYAPTTIVRPIYDNEEEMKSAVFKSTLSTPPMTSTTTTTALCFDPQYPQFQFGGGHQMDFAYPEMSWQTQVHPDHVHMNVYQ